VSEVASRDLVERIRAATAASRLPSPVVVVLEGRARPGAEEGVADGVEVVHAPGEGDETLVSIAAAATEHVRLVSADRGLRERVQAAGADVVGPRWLWARVDQ